MRFRFSDLLIFILLFIFVAAFPIDLIKVAPIYQKLILVGLRSLLIAYYVYIIVRNRIKIFGIANLKLLLFAIPLTLACASNLIAYAIDGVNLGSVMSSEEFVVSLLLSLVTAIGEEIVFRLFIHNSFGNFSSVKRILFSSLIFALMHLINVVNVTTVEALVSILIQVVYTFGLGILLGSMYEYGHSLLVCVIFHFAFNALNKDLIAYLGLASSDLSFYLTAGVIAVILGLYLILLYNLYLKKISNYFRS